MVQQLAKFNSKTQNFYDRIADVQNLAMKVNGYRDSVAKYLRMIDLELDSESVVLDAGTGTGLVTNSFYSAGFRPKKMIALDLSFNSLKVAREQFFKEKMTRAANISAIQGNILNLPFCDGAFDIVFTCGVLEYVPLKPGLREFSRVIKQGGKLILIPVRPSLVGSVLKFLYNFKLHPTKEVRKAAQEHFEIKGDYKFPITEPISWSKMSFLLQKK